jgi:ketosteroid isomerase-like protein
MKKVKVLLIMIVLSINVKAQSRDEREVEVAVKTFNKAIVDADKSVLENLTAEELSYGHSGGKMQNKSEFVEDIMHGPFDFLSIDVANQEIKLSKNVAIVRHLLSFKALNNGTPVNLELGNLVVLQKENGQWKILARQAFKLP